MDAGQGERRSRRWSRCPRRPASGTAGKPSAPHRRFGRRAFLGALGGGALAALLPLRGRSGGLLPLTRGAAAGARRDPVPRPAADPAGPARRPHPDPDPRGRAADPPRPQDEALDLRRQLPRADDPPPCRASAPASPSTTSCRRRSGELSIHLHGGHNRTQFDGQPGGLTKAQPVSSSAASRAASRPASPATTSCSSPGGSKTYVYDLIEDGHPERASFQWYHDHRLDRTAPHIWKGLAGMWIVDDEFEESLSLPRGERDLPLMICDRSFDRDNQLTDPFTSRRPADDGILGETVLVNGAFMPHHPVDPCRYRLRLLNVSSFRSYNLQLSSGAPMVQIATESGLMPKPIRRREILLGPAERVEVIVDFAGAGGRERRAAQQQAPRRPQPRRRPHLRRRPDAVPGRGRARSRTAPACRATCDRCRPGPARPSASPTSAGDHDRRLLQDHLADQRPHLQPGPLRGVPEAEHDRDLGDRQQDQRRPRDAPAPHRLVPARAQRQAAAALAKTASRRRSSSTPTKKFSLPVTSPTTPGNSSSTATCWTTRTTA